MHLEVVAKASPNSLHRDIWYMDIDIVHEHEKCELRLKNNVILSYWLFQRQSVKGMNGI